MLEGANLHGFSFGHEVRAAFDFRRDPVFAARFGPLDRAMDPFRCDTDAEKVHSRMDVVLS